MVIIFQGIGLNIAINFNTHVETSVDTTNGPHALGRQNINVNKRDF
jgi:hypothetical protein